ncbi:MAG: aldehyde ferredoxin oxidoreductase family protein [Promethearchaeota archaeon]
MGNLYGWHGNLLRINLTLEEFKIEPIPEEILKQYMGGRGLGVKYFTDEVDPSVDPLAEQNKLVIATGPMTGTVVPTSGRFSATSKSPLTGTIFDCNSGGSFGPTLKFCGFDALIIEGKLPAPGYVLVTRDGAEFKDAGVLWGKMISEVTADLKGTHGSNARVSCIGPAGENQVLFACVINDMHHALGRGGFGAILGSKNLKAIVVDPGEKASRVKTPVAADGDLKVVIKEINKRINASPLTGKGLKLFGTVQLVNLMNAVGMFPVHNFQSGFDARADELSGERIRETIFKSKTACFMCSIACGRMTETSSGRKGKGPEYESDWALGADCGIFNLEAVTEANYDCNEYGLDTISCGATLACAMELNQNGKLPVDWSHIRFENADVLHDIIRIIALKEGIGADLALGSKRLAEKFGMPDLAMQVKGLELPAYDPRGAFGMALAYATSNRGACHLRAYTIGAEILGLPKLFDRFSFSDKPDLVVKLQNTNAFYDSLVACKFTGMGVPDDYYTRAASAILGYEMSVTDAEVIGERIFNLERDFNTKLGFSREDDLLPPRFSTPLKSGASAGKVPPVDLMLAMYYDIRGWDPTGKPTRSKLEELQLD